MSYNNNVELIINSTQTTTSTSTSSSSTRTHQGAGGNTLVECVLCNKKVQSSKIVLLSCSVKCVDYFRVCSDCAQEDGIDKSTVDFSLTTTESNTNAKITSVTNK